MASKTVSRTRAPKSEVAPKSIAGDVLGENMAANLGNLFTTTEARKAGAFGDVKSAAETVAALKGLVDNGGRTVMWQASLLTHNVIAVAEEIGEGKAFKDQNDYASHIGYSKGYITLLKRLGRAAVVHGVRFDSENWGWLCANLDKSAAKGLRDLCDGTDGKAFRDAVTAARTAPKVAAKRTPQLPEGPQTNTPQEPEVVVGEVVRVAPTAQDIIAGLADLETMSHSLDAEGWAKVEDNLNRWIADMVKRLQTPVTPATVAKRTAAKGK